MRTFVLYLLAVFLTLSVVFGFLAYYYHTRADSYCELWKSSQANVDYLVKKRKEDNEKTILISERNKELEEAARQDNFDWMADISNSAVVKRLQSN